MKRVEVSITFVSTSVDMAQSKIAFLGGTSLRDRCMKNIGRAWDARVEFCSVRNEQNCIPFILPLTAEWTE